MSEANLHGPQTSSLPVHMLEAASSHEPKPAPHPPAGGARIHVVCVPGFGGFDALGQIQYYPCTTEVAAEWRRHAPSDVRRQRLVLHYFENLPTAGVNTRAERLRRFLVKRCERNEFQDGDKIALVGHSTGGLDIRRLLELLARDASSSAAPDHAHARALKKMIKRVVFLSVPQRGTNLANWARALSVLRIPSVWVVRTLTDAVDDARFEWLDVGFWRNVHRLRMKLARTPLGAPLEKLAPDLYAAVLDVFTEASQRLGDDPIRSADGREALADLDLYLSQTNGDFLAIDNLAVSDPNRSRIKRALRRLAARVSSKPESEDNDVNELARLSEDKRELERARWREDGIEVLSFATFGTPAIPEREQHDNDQLHSLRALRRVLPDLTSQADGPYRLVYTACASGPFARVRARVPPKAPDHAARGTLFAGTRDQSYAGFSHEPLPREVIRAWENDGIVNTASMLWPNGEDTLLVQGDHADIIGHYGPSLAPPEKTGRKYGSYDIFSSGSGFDDARFRKVWFRIFDHCATALAPTLQATVDAAP